MARLLFFLALAAGLLAAAPLEAQRERLGSNCRRQRVRPEREQERSDRRRPEERARDSLKARIIKEITEDARAAARAAGVESPEGIFLVTYVKDRPEDAEFLAWRSNVPHEVLAGALERAMPRLADWPDREPAHLNLRLDSIPLDVDSTAAHVVECVPMLENRDEISEMISVFARHNERLLGGPGQERGVEVKMLLSREGEVVHASVRRSSGDAQLDGYALSLVHRMRFRPASYAGRPVDVWITLPVSIRSPTFRGRSAPWP